MPWVVAPGRLLDAKHGADVAVIAAGVALDEDPIAALQ